MHKTAGYSGKPLPKKLGIRSGMKVIFQSAPPGYHDALGPLPPDVRILQRISSDMDLVHGFVMSRAELEKKLPRWRDSITNNGMVWVSWPKKTSGVDTDLDGNVVRATGLACGLVDIKVCAVTEIWSGLKFVWPVESR